MSPHNIYSRKGWVSSVKRRREVRAFRPHIQDITNQQTVVPILKPCPKEDIEKLTGKPISSSEQTSTVSKLDEKGIPTTFPGMEVESTLEDYLAQTVKSAVDAKMANLEAKWEAKHDADMAKMMANVTANVTANLNATWGIELDRQNATWDTKFKTMAIQLNSQAIEINRQAIQINGLQWENCSLRQEVFHHDQDYCTYLESRKQENDVQYQHLMARRDELSARQTTPTLF